MRAIVANMINFWSSELLYPDFPVHFQIKSRAFFTQF